jgi:WD40 repeat protein
MAHDGGVASLAFSPDGKTLVTGSLDKTVKLWDAALKGHTNYVQAVAFSPDGKLLASAGEDKAVRLWGVRAEP